MYGHLLIFINFFSMIVYCNIQTIQKIFRSQFILITLWRTVCNALHCILIGTKANPMATSERVFDVLINLWVMMS